MLLLAGVTAWAGGTQETPQGTTMAADREKTPIEIYNPGFAYPTEPIKLTVWDYYDERPDRIAWEKEKAKEYETLHPNVSITVVNIPWVGWQAKYLSAFQAGTGPDVCTWDISLSVATGHPVPAPAWAVKLIEEKYSDAALQKMQSEGKYWGWPSQLDVGQMLYYNTKMYREGGLNPDAPPKTLPELVEAMKKTTKYDGTGEIIQGGWAIRYFGDVPSIADKWSMFLMCFWDGQQGRYFTEDYGDVLYENPEYAEALQLYQDMVYKWKVASTKMPKPVEAFQLGLTAMTNRESFMIGHLNREAPDLEFAIAPAVNGAAPYGKYQVGTALSPGQSMMVTSKNYPDISWDFSLWLNNEENDLTLARMQGGLPTYKANMQSDYVKEEIPYGKVAETVFARPPLRVEVDPWGIKNEVQHHLGDAVVAVITQKADPKTAAAEAAIQARAVIAKAKAAQ
jgi:multiple sugar transport system substrate-binding protein